MSLDRSPSSRPGDYAYLREELRRRTRGPAKSFPFVTFVLLAVILVGGLGSWVELVKLANSERAADFSGVVTSVITYFPTLAVPACLQLSLASQDRHDKVMLTFALATMFVIALAAVALAVVSISRPMIALWVGTALSVLSVWIWWITNCDDPTYHSPPADASTGGDPRRDLAGDLSNFET